jgi:hypothetical protein
VFENVVLRRIFGPKREGMKGRWRKLHNKEFQNLRQLFIKYYYRDQMKEDEIERNVARMGEMEMYTRF